jgi:hypothetical protein
MNNLKYFSKSLPGSDDRVVNNILQKLIFLSRARIFFPSHIPIVPEPTDILGVGHTYLSYYPHGGTDH